MFFDMLSVTFVAILGLSLGSFLNVVIFRLPRPDLSVARPARSFCPLCQTPIKWHDNLPVFSWLLLGGRCRSCRARIALRYPVVELVSGLLAVAVFHLDGFSFQGAVHLYFVLALLAISLIDLEVMIIPDHLTVPGMVLGLLAAAIAPSPDLSGPWLESWLSRWGWGLRWSSLAGSVLGLLIGGGSFWLVGRLYRLWRGQIGIGDGDLTLMAMIGAFLGWRSVPIVAFTASLFGLAVAVPLLLRPSSAEKDSYPSAAPEESLPGEGRPQGGEEAGAASSAGQPWPAGARNDNGHEAWPDEGGLRMPFGPFLSLAALLYLFWGAKFWAWYLP